MTRTTYLADALLDHTLRNTAYTSPTTVYVGLFTAAPTIAGGGTEVTGGSYARVAATFGAAGSRSITNTSAVSFPTATGDLGTATHFGIFDASSGGNLLHFAILTTSKTILTGEDYAFAIGELVVTETDES